jgi:hypothetical protein
MKPINIFCGRNAHLLNVKVGGTYIDHCASMKVARRKERKT